MKDVLITQLRDKNTDTQTFRQVSENLGWMLAAEAAGMLRKDDFEVTTPLGHSQGWRFPNRVVLVPILRAGMALLHAFLKLFPDAPVGFVGLRRDEVTAEAYSYYFHLPPIGKEDYVLILEPMLATGGTSLKAVQSIVEAGAREENIIFVSVISAPEGKERLQARFPELKLLIAQEDPKLNDKKFIEPGLGDFGDRFFGTPN